MSSPDGDRGRSIWSRAAVGVLLLVTLPWTVGCSGRTGETSPDPRGADPTPAAVQMSFQQLPIQVGTRQGLLRVVNTGRSQLHVTGVGLDWPAYGPLFTRDKDRVLAAGQTVDFPVTLPPPRCAAAAGPVRGVVSSDDVTLRTVVDAPGTTLLRRVRQHTCDLRFVAERVGLRYAGPWHAVGHGRGASVVGTLRLVRRSGREPVTAVGAGGSVLYDVSVPVPASLAARARLGRVPLRIAPGNRCDEHARGQATAPFSFRVTLRVGTRVVSVPIPPPTEVREQITALLERACR